MINDWLARRAQLTPDKTALIDTLHHDRPITYRAWNQAADQLAHTLRTAYGVGRGDRVAILAPNGVPYLTLWFACGKLGAILQTLNWRLTVPELSALVADGTPTVLVYGEAFAEAAQALKTGPGFRPAGVVALDQLTAEAAAGPSGPVPPAAVGWEDPWVICYTGGTTGLPKGALLTYRAITANSVNTVMSWGLTPDDMAILNAPLFHTGGLNVFTAPLVHIGGTSIVCRGFDADQVYDLLAGAPVTLFFGVPTMFAALQQHPRWATADFTKLKIVISGGAPCPRPIFERFWERGVDFKTGYGLTEAGPNTFWLPKAEVRRKPGAVGYPLFHVDVKVVDALGAECAAGEIGELWIRGPHVCGGYWNRPDETARAITEGWLHTGDLASRDADGCYTIVGRSKEVIISGGENVYPAEVESVLAAHPAVAEAALIGVPDAHWGEVGWAVMVTTDPTLTAEAVLEFCRPRLARYKLPKHVVFIAALPKTAAGKIDKRWLMERYAPRPADPVGE